jgi:hypothetical protein
MGHYDDAYENHYAEARRVELEHGRHTIEGRLNKIAGAMRTLGMQGASVVEEAIEHIKG